MMRRYTRFALATVLVAGLALRAITPAGYMPASLADGIPFVLCHNSTPGARVFLELARGEHAHHQGSTPESSTSAWDSCPFGVAFSAAAPAYDVVAALAFDATFETAVVTAVIPRSAPSRNFQARGPPSFAS